MPGSSSAKRGNSRSWDNELQEPQHFLQNITHFTVVCPPSLSSPSTPCLTIFISIILMACARWAKSCFYRIFLSPGCRGSLWKSGSLDTPVKQVRFSGKGARSDWPNRAHLNLLHTGTSTKFPKTLVVFYNLCPRGLPRDRMLLQPTWISMEFPLKPKRELMDDAVNEGKIYLRCQSHPLLLMETHALQYYKYWQ